MDGGGGYDMGAWWVWRDQYWLMFDSFCEHRFNSRHLLINSHASRLPVKGTPSDRFDAQVLKPLPLMYHGDREMEDLAAIIRRDIFTKVRFFSLLPLFGTTIGSVLYGCSNL